METKDIKRGVLIGGASLAAVGSIYGLTKASDMKMKIVFGAAALVSLWVLKKGVMDKAEGFFDLLGKEKVKGDKMVKESTEGTVKTIGNERFVLWKKSAQMCHPPMRRVGNDCYKPVNE